MEIMEYLKKFSGEIVAIVGSVELSDFAEYKILPSQNIARVEDYFLKFSTKEKLLKALQVVELNDAICNKDFKNLNIGDINKLAIVESLLTKESLFIFENINKGLNHRECENIKRVLKKLNEHQKTIVVVTNDVDFLFNLTKHVLVVDKNNVVKPFNPINWFDSDVYNYISKPPIIDFIEYCRSRKIKIENALETKELLKSIYRSVNK